MFFHARGEVRMKNRLAYNVRKAAQKRNELSFLATYTIGAANSVAAGLSTVTMNILPIFLRQISSPFCVHCMRWNEPVWCHCFTGLYRAALRWRGVDVSLTSTRLDWAFCERLVGYPCTTQVTQCFSLQFFSRMFLLSSRKAWTSTLCSSRSVAGL